MELHLSQQLLENQAHVQETDKKILHSPHLSTFFSKRLHSHTQREGSKVSAHWWRQEGTTRNRRKGEQRGQVKSRELARLSCTETPPGARITFYPSVFVSTFNLCPGNLPLLRLQVRAGAPRTESARLYEHHLHSEFCFNLKDKISSHPAEPIKTLFLFI